MPPVASDGRTPVAVFAAAGVYTSPTFMTGVLAEAVRRLQTEAGLSAVRSGLLFPYGDWDRRLPGQLRAVYGDLRLQPEQVGRSAGGRVVAKAMEEADRATRFLLLGHSGGGLASVHAAAQLLERRPSLDVRIALIGSPRFAVPPQLKERVVYLHAAGRNGRSTRDPICRIGGWGGWERDARGWPRWNPRKLAPGKVLPVTIVGGHADYFRDRDPFCNEGGLSNLDIVLTAILRELDLIR